MRHGLHEHGVLLLSTPASAFDGVLAGLLEPRLRRLSDRLRATASLSDVDREVLLSGVRVALRAVVWSKVSRLLVLELNAARLTGRLTAASAEGRWAQWTEAAAGPGFWAGLTEHYPSLLERLNTLIGRRCAAAADLAVRLAGDRPALGELSGGELGELVEVRPSVGDAHRGGQTVAIVHGTGGRVVYKPRSVAVDRALRTFLRRVELESIAVPRVLVRDGYGWAEFVEHRYCADDAELRRFYRGMGHWLAVLRVLGGSDLHAENLIAAGPVPVVVDCETLFTPYPPTRASGLGQAVDLANERLNDSVLRIGLLPARGTGLGWRGVDSSAVGSLPGQQPAGQVPVVLDAGTDVARVGLSPSMPPSSANHPSPEPALGRHWAEVVDGFTELAARVDAHDRSGHLAGWLAEFADLPIRVVPRSTEAYAELGRMLWHPTSLHDQTAAVDRAGTLLTRQARNLPRASGDPEVIAAEVADLLTGDVPFFSTTPRLGRLTGPGGVRHGEARDLVADALRHWRNRDAELDVNAIRASVMSAYLNEGWLPRTDRMAVRRLDPTDLDRRRRAAAAGVLRALSDGAIRAEDGTVTWISLVLNATGWSVQALGNDLYTGAAGLAVVLAAYLRETAAGRADPVAGVAALLAATIRTMRLAEQRWTADRAAGDAQRPDAPGGYGGLASRISAWLLLRELGAAGPEALTWAAELAERIPDAVRADEWLDVFAGMAGAVVPLLRLAEHTGDSGFRDLATDIGHRLVRAAVRDDGTARWPTERFPLGIGGFSHGATGIGWALARLSTATGEERFADVATAAATYEETLYDAARGGWRDLREPDRITDTWCHGSGGVGVAAADLSTVDSRYPEVLRRAAAAVWARGLGLSHTLCHGDLGNWETLRDALDRGLGPPGLTRELLDARVLGSIEEHGAAAGLIRGGFAPGLMPGLAGMTYQLLRLHPDCPLPSLLLPDPGGPAPG